MSDHNDCDDHPNDSSVASHHETSFDPELDVVSEEVLAAIATINDTDPTKLEVLADSVDPDALDALFQPRANGRRRDSDPLVQFRYSDHNIEISSNGTITIRPDTPPDN